MVCPVHQPPEVVPFVHTAKFEPIAQADRHPFGQVDIVGDQQRAALRKLQNEALMAISVAIVGQ